MFYIKCTWNQAIFVYALEAERLLCAGGPLTRICLSAPTFTPWRMNAESRISITLMQFDSSLALWGNSVHGKALVSHWSLLFSANTWECGRSLKFSALFSKNNLSAAVLVGYVAVLLNSTVKLYALALLPLLLPLLVKYQLGQYDSTLQEMWLRSSAKCCWYSAAAIIE